MEALRKSIGNISELPCVLLSFLRVPNRFACFCAFFCKPEKTHHHKSWIMPPNLLTWTQRLNGPHIFLHAKTKTVYYTKYWSWKREITHMEKQMKAYKNFFIKTFFLHAYLISDIQYIYICIICLMHDPCMSSQADVTHVLFQLCLANLWSQRTRRRHPALRWRHEVLGNLG